MLAVRIQTIVQFGLTSRKKFVIINNGKILLKIVRSDVIKSIRQGRSFLLFISLLLIIFSIMLLKSNRELKKSIHALETTQGDMEVEIFFAGIKDRSQEAEILHLKELFTLEEEELARLEKEKVEKEKIIAEQEQKKRVASSATPTRGGTSRNFKATAYDLSVASCGKSPSHPAYGITASGFDLKGKTLEDRYIAVDRSKIKLGSEVHIEFFEPYTHLTGYYTAVDTGGAIKGNKVDIFFGSGDVSTAVKNFGRRDVVVTY